MAGEKESRQELDLALLNAVNLLETQLDCEWFVFYGTMLGLYRDGSCIDGDDDVDIMVNCNMGALGVVLEREGYTTNPQDRDDILKTRRNRLQDFASVDFYFCTVEDNDWYSTWEKTWIRDVKIEQIDFRGTKINIPNNPEQRLAQMYGSNWQTPIRGVKVGSHKDIKG